MKTKALSGLILGAALSVVAVSSQAIAEKWDMALAYAATNYHSEVAAEFAKAVTDGSNGKLEIEAHAGGSLFGGSEIYSAVRRGLAPIGERFISALGNEEALYEVDSIPFLATSFADAKALYEVSKPVLEAKLDEAGLVFLYSVPWPPQGLYANKDVASKADLKGLKFRAYNAMTEKLAQGLGMLPTKIESAEISQAFATGVAESMITSGATGYDKQIWDQVSHYYDVRAWVPRNMVFVNKKAWDALDAETQAVVRAAAADAEAKGWAKAEELADWYVDQFSENGMTVDAPSEQLMADFKAVGETLTADWLSRTGEEGQALIDAYQAKR